MSITAWSLSSFGTDMLPRGTMRYFISFDEAQLVVSSSGVGRGYAVSIRNRNDMLPNAVM